MREIKRIAKVGEKIKVVIEGQLDWGQVVYPLGSVWTVRKVMMENCRPPGLTSCKGNKYDIWPDEYVVLVEK